MSRRVVMTGMSALTPLGNDWGVVRNSLKDNRSGIIFMEEWQAIQGLSSFLAAPVDVNPPDSIPRKQLRSMGRVSLIAVETAQKALLQSELALSDIGLENVGVAYGSSFGSALQLPIFSRVLSEKKVRGVSPTGYVQMMSHTAAVNLSLYFGAKGRLYPTSSACASGGQAIGYACEAIRQGIHPVMIAGSAEELSPIPTAVFDSFYAACRSSNVEKTARPFSNDRNGMVVGEGGASFILEDLDHALQRSAPIIAEVVGFASNMDGAHIARQDVNMMQGVMELALESASLQSEQIGYINAHASGTDGDSVEVNAIRRVFGDNVPVSSSKGHIGHALGGCGALEAWLSIQMMNDKWFAPTHGLHTIADDCDGIFHIPEDGLSADCDYIMSNNFAFGGVNVSLIFKRWVSKG